MQFEMSNMTANVRAELDAIYQQKLEATRAFAPVPKTEGPVYYISSLNGNDENDGSSPATAWKSVNKASGLPEGSTVLFECGSVFHATPLQDDTAAIYPKSNSTFATYGTGAKPIFYGSANGDGKESWTCVAKDVYVYKDPIPKSKQIAGIVFDNGKAWGIKIQMTYSKDDSGNYTIPAYQSLALANVSNGIETFEKVESFPLKTGEELTTYDLAFYHNTDTGLVYLYCKGGNPGERFGSVELMRGQKIFLSGSGVNNLTFLNLDFRCVGEFAIRTGNVENLVIKNCAFTFIGGAVQAGFGKSWRNYDTRLGNAIENWGSCNGMTVENCYFDQIYDTSITTQTNSNLFSKNLVYRNNVSQNMWFGVELWMGDYSRVDNVYENVDISGNYFTKIGMGFPTQRPDKFERDGTPIESFIKVSRATYEITNAAVTDNIVDGAAGKLYCCTQPKTPKNENGYIFDRNTYVHRRGAVLCDMPVSFPALVRNFNGERYSTSTKMFAFDEGTVEALRKEGYEVNSRFYFA